VTPADVVQAVPLTQDPAFRAAVIGLVVSLTTLLGYIGGWFMRQSKTKKESENQPGQPYEMRRQADKELHQVKGEVKDLKSDVKELSSGLEALSEKADELADGIERASDRIQGIDDKVNDAATEVAKLSEAMDWVKDSLLAIKAKLGVV
jgi:X-X-X-Leu-X-X-Gly heptad repeat protein